jgi:hypothetical protein
MAMSDEAAAPKKRFNLETVTNIAIILLCVVASVVLIRNHFFPPRPPGMPQGPEVGERLDAVKAILPAGSARTLVVAIAPTCHYCNESMPFYKSLMDERNRKGSPVKVVGAIPAPEAKDEESKHMTAAGVAFDALSPIAFPAIKVPGTPTLYLVDDGGKVQKVWVGKLTADQEKEVLAIL